MFNLSGNQNPVDPLGNAQLQNSKKQISSLRYHLSLLKPNSQPGLTLAPCLVLMASQIPIQEFCPVIHARNLRVGLHDWITGRGIHIQGACPEEGDTFEVDSSECDALIEKYQPQVFIDTMRLTPYDPTWVIKYSSKLKTL